ncbi:hypothetical protein LJ754_08010 [Arthrobacter sp. zg-Y40]|uniref:hypothetical protein n=1 Tax=unclassified Arthrobacter TaxID=235627 RepID=UPI001D152F60|nr:MULTISPECIES: hypothetical protein [unclassified Arthrobacter]MCC3274934.1 hypothetical protein [Arthrobacter sp. zg-Y20]MCC3279094.1 hypothetical protein [Arthrobacter sp. zg-Y40]MDK1315090.1 hypothetical protein [Arthrobacter sp. zg.Y20]MDK1327954.1 hypothetical protein [Arthrobacter sp. zg-Y1143]WIB04936.1 hypothetical protein QNO06_10215 [Arthrobacter sp. zg-Y20]
MNHLEYPITTEGNTMSTPNESYELARRHVIAKTVYKGVVGLWLLLAVFQVAIWYFTTPGGYFWPIWPILGTLIAAVVAGIPTYSRRPAISDSRIEAELARMRRNN